MLKDQISAWIPVFRNAFQKVKLLAKKEGLKLLAIFMTLAWCMQKDLTVQVNFSTPHDNGAFTKKVAVQKKNNKEVKRKDLRYRNYIKKFAPMALKEMKAHNIPASIILAQGLLESDGGASKLATENNNHFGIKCFSRNCSKGHCSNFTDDSHKDFFKVYNSASESYRDHSEFLKKDRYKHLTNLPISNFISWAYGLKKAGYATDKKYAEKLIRLINQYELSKYDTP